jgi:hypothetical protein
MEIDLDLNENPWITWLALAVIIALVLVGLAFIGRNATPLDVATGEPRVIEWSDWQILQARRAHNKEIAILREDLTAIASMFQQPPDPVSAQILRSRIAQHTRSGQPTLELARAHLQNAAEGLVAWSSSQMEREELIALIQQAEAALK